MSLNNDDSKPFFYIMLPTFNRPYKVLKAVNSVIKQDYKNYKLVIFNAGSSEKYDELEQLIVDNDHVTYIKSPNIGINKSRNKMLDDAANQPDSLNMYFFTLSDDDYLSNNSLEIMAQEIQTKPNTIWFSFNCECKSKHILNNQDYSEYLRISYSNFRRKYHGDKHFVFKLNAIKNIRYPNKFFKNGFEHIFYYKIPSKIQIVPKSVKIIEYFEDGLSMSDLYQKSNSFSSILKHIYLHPLNIHYYHWLMRKFYPKEIIKYLITEEKYYALKKYIRLKRSN